MLSFSDLLAAFEWARIAVAMQRSEYPLHSGPWNLRFVFLLNFVLFPIALPLGVWRIVRDK